MLEGSYFALLSAFIITDLADRNLLDGNLPTVLHVDTLVEITERAMTNHLAKLPFGDRQGLLRHGCNSLRILVHVVLRLLIVELKTHISDEHEIKRNHECPHCSKAFG